MTTKAKIVVGFSLMISLIAALAIMGYLSATNSQDGFAEYQRLARFNTAASDMTVEMYAATGEISGFMSSRDPRAVERAKGAIGAAGRQVAAMQDLAIRAERKNEMRSLGERVAAYTGTFDSIQSAVHDADKYYSDVLVEMAATLQENFAVFTRASERAQDVAGLVLITDALNRLAAARSSVARYASSRDDADARLFDGYAKEIRAAIAKIDKNVVSERGKQLMRELQAANDAYINGFAVLVQKNQQTAALLGQMNANVQALLQDVRKVSETRDAEMRAFGAGMRESNARSETISVALGAAGLLLGGLITFIIVRGLSKVLHNLSSFASRVAYGDFAAQPNVKEGGEIGIMVASMQEIPAVINKVMDGAKVLCDRVLAGDFRARMEVGEYYGGFAELAATVNTVGDAYTDVLDLMPVPIKTCDPKKRIRFLNSVAQSVVGGNPVNEPCAQFIKSGVCNTENCFGENCMKKDTGVSGETSMNPHIGRMDAHVTAIPLKDGSDSIVGYIEIINDITEIKDKQNTIVRVANQASEIADRVAAASEQIATQVEQISRGADVQRERVETTAGAMTEMNSTVLEVARNAGQASEQSETTRAKAEDGANLVRQVVSSIQTVNSVTQAMQQNM
ncbi:hypothetical protein LJC48_06450, partial [Desulfovibrio sp. OttesenSCG-928-C06]|nr:hypothetical protein [Desulfovibrio sp. OttesenSCG-928-C06]